MAITATFAVFRHKCHEVGPTPAIGVSLVIVIALVGATTLGV
jgi:hypothetical protein